MGLIKYKQNEQTSVVILLLSQQARQTEYTDHKMVQLQLLTSLQINELSRAIVLQRTTRL